MGAAGVLKQLSPHGNVSQTNAPVDSKKEEFRKYLEKSGVLDALTKALVRLFEEPERPDNAVAYIKARLEPDAAEDSAVNALKHELDETKRKLEALQIQHDHIRSQITKGEVEEAVVAEPI